MIKNTLIALLSIILIILMSKDKASNKSPIVSNDTITLDPEKKKMVDLLLDESSGKNDEACLKYTHYIDNSFFQQAIYDGNNIYCEIKFIKDGIETIKKIELSTVKSVINKKEKEEI